MGMKESREPTEFVAKVIQLTNCAACGRPARPGTMHRTLAGTLVCRRCASEGKWI